MNLARVAAIAIVTLGTACVIGHRTPDSSSPPPPDAGFDVLARDVVTPPPDVAEDDVVTPPPDIAADDVVTPPPDGAEDDVVTPPPDVPRDVPRDVPPDVPGPACGGPGQDCCVGAVCDSGTACYMGTCAICGTLGQACCPGASCGSGMMCEPTAITGYSICTRTSAAENTPGGNCALFGTACSMGQCVPSTTMSTAGHCAHCGRAGEACCGAFPPTCGSPATCNTTSRVCTAP